LAALVVISLLVTLLPAFDQAIATVIKAQPILLLKASEEPDARLDIIVQKTVKDDRVEQTVKNLGGIITSDLHIINAFTAEIPAKAVLQLGQAEGVRYVSLDAPVTTSSSADTIDTKALTNVYDRAINADKLWNQSLDGVNLLQGQGIGVAVVDSGINNKPDFYNQVKIGSRIKLNVKIKTSNFVGTDDLYGHGSLVAGVVAGNGSASKGAYVGIAPQANLLNVKVSDEDGQATTGDLVSGLQWVNDNKDRYNIRVVNISLNSAVKQSYQVDPLCAAAEILWFNGIVVVVSAGNNGSADLYPPANDPFVITVGATDDAATASVTDDSMASFSAFGTDETGATKPDLVAPGRNLVSVLASDTSVLAKTHSNNKVNGNNYFRVSGTSFSAPVVSGAVALLLQTRPWLNPDQVKYILKATALQNKPRGNWDRRASWPGYDPVKAGAGYLDIYAAVTQFGIVGTANTGLPASQLLWTGSSPINWSSVKWSSVNWSSVNWSSVNWSSVNWSSVNWSSDYWES
jgi:serine protease AprX